MLDRLYFNKSISVEMKMVLFTGLSIKGSTLFHSACLDLSKAGELGNYDAYDMIKGGAMMSGEHMVKLVDFLADWRDSTHHRVPNSACVSGGGEPYMNKEINTLFERMHHHVQ